MRAIESIVAIGFNNHRHPGSAVRLLQLGFVVLTAIVLQAVTSEIRAQYVPNPSFEEREPILLLWPNNHTQPGGDQMSRLNHWYNPTEGTSDWYHENALPVYPGGPIWVGVPTNVVGVQEAIGQGYVGMIIQDDHRGAYREYVQTQLLQPLLLGQRYRVSFQVSRAENYGTGHSIRNLGALFSEQPIRTNLWDPLIYEPQVHSDVFLTSTGGPNNDQWMTISNIFTVQHEDKYFITLGNFQSDISGDQVQPTVPVDGEFTTYYYVDNVEIELLEPDCTCNYTVDVARAIEDQPGKCCYEVTITNLANACPAPNIRLRVGSYWQEYHLQRAPAPGESVTLDFCVDEFHGETKTLAVEMQDRNRVPICSQEIETALECPCACYEVEFERNYNKADECCYFVTLNAFDKSCDLHKVRISSGRFPGHEFIEEFNPPLQANGSRTFEYCAPSTEFIAIAEFDVEFLDANDMELCEPAMVPMLCRCACVSTIDGSLSAHLEATESVDDMCCWDVVLNNDADCDRVIFGVSVGGPLPLVGFPSTVNPDWVVEPLFEGLLISDFGWSKVDAGFNGAYVEPNSSEIVGRICLPAGSDPMTVDLAVHYSQATSSCEDIEFEIDCPLTPENCCDVLHADIVTEWGGTPPFNWENPCGRFLHLFQDRSLGCNVHGIRVTDVGSGALLLDVPYNPAPDGVVDLSDPTRVWLHYYLPCGGVTRTIRVEFLDIHGQPFCSEEISASCNCPGDIFLRPGGLGATGGVETAGPEIVSIRPNPARDDAEIIMNLTATGAATLEVFDLSGKLIAHYDIGLRSAGSHVVRLSVAALPAGSYRMRLNSGGQQVTLPFSVLP